MKNIKIWVAKVIIFLILFGIISIGLLKFIDYLEGPSDNFLSYLNSINNTTNDLKEVFNNKLYNLFNGKVQISADTKILTKNASDTEYQTYLDYLEDANIISNIKFDKENNYIFANTKITKNEKEYDFDYIEDGLIKYIQDKDNYEKIISKEFNIKAFDRNIYPLIMNKFIDKLKEYILNHEITTSNDIITINNVTYNSNIISLFLDGNDTIELLNSFISSLIYDSAINNYLNKIYNTTDSNLEAVLKSMLDSYGIDNTHNYVFKIIVNNSNKDVIKFSFVQESNVLFSYELLKDYYALQLKDVNYIIKGSKDNFELTIIDDTTTTFTYKESDFSFSGEIIIANKYRIQYSSEIVPTETNSSSISLTMNIYPITIKDGMVLEIKSSILVTNNTNITKKNVLNSIKSTNKSFEDYVLKYLKDIYDNLNLEQEPINSEN